MTNNLESQYTIEEFDPTDINYVKINKNLTQAKESLKRLLMYKSNITGKSKDDLSSNLETVNLLYQILTRENSNYEYSPMFNYDDAKPNDIARILLGRSVDRVVTNFQKPYSESKKKALEALEKFINNGAIKIYEFEKPFTGEEDNYVEEVRKSLSSCPHSLADIIQQERRDVD